jgi:hypothetical protein
MKIPETILITVFYKGHFVDVEMPTDIYIKDIEDRIDDILNAYFKDNSIIDTVPNEISLFYENKPLDKEKLLVNYGIWDGSIVEVR